MKTLLIRNVLFDGKTTDILVAGNRFENLSAPAGTCADEVLDASGMAILPPFYNTHTHAAMSLLRGYADDMPLQKWLSEHVWPFEDKLTPEDIREGSEIAVREMIKSGTVFFSDMYFDIEETIDVVNRYGIRAAIGVTFIETHTKTQQAEKLRMLSDWTDPSGGRISLTVAPHSVYTVGPGMLARCAEVSRELGLKLHIHISETAREVEDCVRDHGMTPVRYLDSLGVLGPNVIGAHVVHVDREEADILAERGVTVSHCPCSNMKLASGMFPYKMLREAGCRITLGTDGDSSNNNLDMGEEMKFASLLAKLSSNDPEVLCADEALAVSGKNGAEFFGIDAGIIEEGRLADALLVRLDEERMMPCHHLVSNWVYSADSSCIDTVICDGRIIMKNNRIQTLS